MPSRRRLGKVPGPIVARLPAWSGSSLVDRRKVIRDCGIDGGVESYQTVEDEFVVDFLKSLDLSQLTPRLTLAQLCPNCHQVMPLTGICDNCG